MIGHSTGEYLFIQACICFLHYIAPLSAFYCIFLLALRSPAYRIPPVIEIWAIAEAAFLLLLYIPRNIILQQAASHPEVLPKEERKRLFQLCLDTLDDPEHYLRGWFRGASLSDIKRENVKGTSLGLPPSKPLTNIEFFCWAFLNKTRHGLVDDEELENYVNRTEVALGRKFQPGRGKAISLRTTVDEVKTKHRSCKSACRNVGRSLADDS